MKESKNNIKVFIRIRPFKSNENPTEKCIEMQQCEEKTLSVKDKQSNSNLSFTFDHVFGPQTKQLQVYDKVVKTVVQNSIQGINGTIFAYGQTSSGKTHTCIGPNFIDIQLKGILPRIVDYLMTYLNEKPVTTEFKVKLSMVQIYNQKIKDLIDTSKDNLKIRHNKSQGIYIQNVTQKDIINMQTAQCILKRGIDNRSVGSTNMNSQSSRSHMVFIITIFINNYLVGEAKTAKITLIDLAGSQKISKTGAQGKLLQQAKQINKSLSALGKVINLLSESKNAHIPYRDSKLTRLLEQSLGGNSITHLIVNISPSTYNQSQTLSSLRFGYRAKAIENKPKVNKQYTVDQLLKLLVKAQQQIKDQAKVIQTYEKKKRVGGYGAINKITLHLIEDQNGESSSENESNSHKTNSIIVSQIQSERKSRIFNEKGKSSQNQIQSMMIKNQECSNYLEIPPSKLKKKNKQQKDSGRSEKKAKTLSFLDNKQNQYEIYIQTPQFQQKLQQTNRQERKINQFQQQYYKLQEIYNDVKTSNAIKDKMIQRKNSIIENLKKRCNLLNNELRDFKQATNLQ